MQVADMRRRTAAQIPTRVEGKNKRDFRAFLWNTYGTRMEYVWSTYGIPMEQHAANTVSTPYQHPAGRLCPRHWKAGANCGVSEEAASHNVRGQSFVHRSSLPAAPYSCLDSLRPALPAGQCEAGEP